MARSLVTICNNALGEVPADQIASLEDGSVSSRHCLRLYPVVVNDLLEFHDWDFAIKRQAAAQITNDRDSEWGYAYVLPTDIASPLKVIPDYGGLTIPWGYEEQYRSFVDRLPFVIAGGKLYSQLPAPYIEYISNDIPEVRFTAMFGRAVETELAARLVMPIKNDAKRQRELIQIASGWLERAVADDLNRNSRDQSFESERSISRGVEHRSWA